MKNAKKIRGNFRTGKVFIGKEPQVLAAQKAMVKSMVRDRENQNIKNPFQGLVHMHSTFVFPKEVFYTKAGPRSKTVPDLSNLYQLVEDCLQMSGVIQNDNQIESHDGSRRVCGDEYRLELKLFAMSQSF